jgi:hypothetical protein
MLATARVALRTLDDRKGSIHIYINNRMGSVCWQPQGSHCVRWATARVAPTLLVIVNVRIAYKINFVLYLSNCFS